ncbi:glycoside hydrolase family 78 protein [Rathayibacter sp. ZW T2_19]|uniref:alpha-L-rhamnosidase n=1 Tax=Rathayibacter rubneri TaxID=2950106 RepID=A0A9X2DU24_9MICO|nr:family 78 glycoside hydrolase catalytic domain [Rathayibacter rubneri]MCM6761145.1 glycoside hydrolase family 78 protein [Rathayibacter rubneri]
MPHPDAPHALQVETGGDALPISSPEPELSWQLPPGWRRQDAFELQARVGDELLTWAQRSPERRFITWPWRPLTSGESVQWRVRVEHAGATSAWSKWLAFEAGLFDVDWTSAWISSPSNDHPLGARPATAFSTTFDISELPVKARLYATALGLYEAVLNGRRVGSVELAPGSQSYDKTLYAQAYDVTPLLQQGANSLELRLSDGWYRGRAGAFRHQAAWGEQTAVRAELHIDSGAGPVVAAATSTHWNVAETEIVAADLMDGQTTDWSHHSATLGQAVTGPVAPPVSWSPAPPVRVIEERSPVMIDRRSADCSIVDFGQNVSGRMVLRDLGPAGTRTVIDYGEHLDVNGDLTLTHLDTPAPDGTVVPFVQRDEVISDGQPGRVFEPRHTIHGFRYARLQRDGSNLDLDETDVTLQVLHTDFTPVGAFNCSDPDLTALYSVAEWSFRGNAVDLPTDCPTRERAGWTGDYQIFLPTAVRLFDVAGFSRKWLQSVRDDQLADGRIVNMSPDNARLGAVPDPMTDMATGSAGWGDAVVLVPWELYRTYGDRAALTQNWAAMVKWVQFALTSAAERRHPSRVERSATPLPHEQYIWDGTFHFGEWLEPTPLNADGTPGPAMPDPMAWAMADKGEVGTAYLYRSLSVLAQVARVLGKTEEADSFANTAERVRTAWQQEFLDENGRVSAGTQAGYVRALAFDLLPEELRAQAADHLVSLVREADDHLTTGFLSTADLLPVLADTGHPEIAHALLLQRTTPSWLGMLDRGATTIWEEWEGVDRNGVASASLNHYSKGAVIRYLQTHTLGLRQHATSIAWESFIVDPVIPAHLTWAEGHFDGPQGRIEVRWEKTDAGSSIEVTVPAGSTAQLRWNGSERILGPGLHQF